MLLHAWQNHKTGYMLLNIFCSSSLYAAAFSEPIYWGQRLRNKLVMPCEQTVKTPGIARCILFNRQLIITSRYDSGARIYHVKMPYQDVVTSRNIPAPESCDEKLAIDSNGEVAIVGTTPARVCIISESEKPPISVRIKNNDNIIKLGVAAPLAGIMAIYARNKKTDKKYIGLCSIANRSIYTFVPACSAQAYVDITTLALSDDGSTLAWGTDDGSLYIRQTAADAKERLLRSFFNKMGKLITLAWSPDKNILACSVATMSGIGHLLFLIATGSGTIFHDQKIDGPLTACTFIDNTTLAFCTPDETHIHKLHLRLPGITSFGIILANLTPSAQELCTETATCIEPYELKASEQETYKKLPELLQQPWLFKALAR